MPELVIIAVERTPEGWCSVCGSNFKEGATRCHAGHSTGETYRRPKYGYGPPLTRVVQAVANGTKCLLCGGQVDEGDICSVLRHQMGSYYPMDRAHAPSLFE